MCKGKDGSKLKQNSRNNEWNMEEMHQVAMRKLDCNNKGK